MAAIDGTPPSDVSAGGLEEAAVTPVYRAFRVGMAAAEMEDGLVTGLRPGHDRTAAVENRHRGTADGGLGPLLPGAERTRTAFLVYVRVLLCLQGLGLLFLAWAFISDRGHGLPGRGSGATLWPLVAFALILALVGLAIILTAVLLRRGRRRGDGSVAIDGGVRCGRWRPRRDRARHPAAEAVRCVRVRRPPGRGAPVVVLRGGRRRCPWYRDRSGCCECPARPRSATPGLVRGCDRRT